MARPAAMTSPAPTAWSMFWRYRTPIAGGVIMLIVTNFASLGIVETVRMLIEALRGGAQPWGGPTWVALLLIALAIGSSVTRIWSRIWIFNAARDAEYDLRSALFRHVVTLDPDYHKRAKTGDIMARLTGDVQTVRAMWGVGLLNLVNTPIAYATSLFMMLKISPSLTLWAVAPYPAIYVVGQFMGKRLYKASQSVQQQVATLSNELTESLGNIQLVKMYGLEGARRDRFASTSAELFRRNMQLVRVRGQLAPALGLLAGLGSLAVLYFGGLAAARRTGLGVDGLVAFTLLVGRLVWPTLALGWMISLVSRGRASWQRLADLLAIAPARTEAGDANINLSAGSAPVAIRVSGLTIERDGHRILDNVSFALPAGSFTALVGPTGCGKSTLLDALGQLTLVPPGTVFVDDRDVRQLSLTELHAAIGYAPQDAFLFSTTIANNIAMGFGAGRAVPHVRAAELEDARFAGRDIDPNDPRVVSAGSTAALAQDIATMPVGYGTVVGERGITLSGGQRQRVALARTIAAGRRLLLLDDSLSSVDADTEQRILHGLDQVMAGRTTVMTSHRIAAIRRADQILVLEHGRVVEQGSHETLLAQNGVYARLYQTQLHAGSA